jgi:indole-3-glycerol phosphate synthase
MLDDILAHKHAELKSRSVSLGLEELKTLCEQRPPCRGFIAALSSTIATGRAAVIAEIKKASPSKGLIRNDFEPTTIAHSYVAGGATCLSILTDEKFFQGADDNLVAVRAAVELPLLRKDFVIDEYQIWEARNLGADCVLLIVAALSDTQLAQYHELTLALGMDALVEVHNAAELRRAAALKPHLVGINNRNLHSFETQLSTTHTLCNAVPSAALVVSESGIHTPADITQLRASGVNAFLIGEAFMRAADPGTALREMFIAG